MIWTSSLLCIVWDELVVVFNDCLAWSSDYHWAWIYSWCSLRLPSLSLRGLSIITLPTISTRFILRLVLPIPLYVTWIRLSCFLNTVILSFPIRLEPCLTITNLYPITRISDVVSRFPLSPALSMWVALFSKIWIQFVLFFTYLLRWEAVGLRL